MMDLNVIEIIEEAGVSASIPLHKRPGGSRLIDVLGRRAAHVVALKLDRVFRCAVDALSQTAEWDKAGIRMHLVDMGGAAVDTGSAMGRFFLNVMAGFAELERGLISERTKAALAYKRQQGEVIGAVPMGFTREGKNLTKNPKELSIIEKVKELRDSGLSYQRVADALNEQGIRSKRGGKWHAYSVQSLLKRLAAA